MLARQPRTILPVWSGVVIWLSAFFSPVGYFFLILLADSLHVQSPPQSVVWSLFFLIPVVALLVCEWIVWFHCHTVAWKLTLMLLTLLGMLLQFGILVAILRAILIARIGYVQQPLA